MAKNSPKLLRIGRKVAKFCSIFWRKIATSGHSAQTPKLFVGSYIAQHAVCILCILVKSIVNLCFVDVTWDAKKGRACDGTYIKVTVLTHDYICDTYWYCIEVRLAFLWPCSALCCDRILLSCASCLDQCVLTFERQSEADTVSCSSSKIF